MAHIVVMGANIGGLPAAYENQDILKKDTPGDHQVTVVSNKANFSFVPSNPWVAVGWRDRNSITFDIGSHLERKGVNFIAKRCDKIDAENKKLVVAGGEVVDYDYLVIATGPRLAFDEIEGSVARIRLEHLG